MSASAAPLLKLPGRRGVIWSLGQAMGLSLLVMACGVAFSRTMEIEQYGELEAALGALAIAAVIATFGLDSVAVRAIRSSATRSQWSHGRGFRTMAPRLILVLAALTWLALVGFHMLIHDMTAVRMESFAAVLALIPLAAINTYLVGTARAHGASSRAKTAWYLKGHALLLVLIILAHFVFGDQFDVFHAAGLLMIAYAISCWLLLRVNREVAHEAMLDGDRTFLHGSWVRSGLAFMIGGLVLMSLDRGGVVVLGWLHADAQASARFAAASRLSWPVAFLALGAHGSYLPVLADAVEHGRTKLVTLVHRAWDRMLWLPVAACVVVIGVLGGWMLSFFGPEFTSAHATLLVLLLAQAVTTMGALLFPLLIYRGRGVIAVATLMIWAIVGTGAMIAGGHYSGDLGVSPEMGVAMGQAGSMIGLQISLHILCHGRTGRSSR